MLEKRGNNNQLIAQSILQKPLSLWDIFGLGVVTWVGYKVLNTNNFDVGKVLSKLADIKQREQKLYAFINNNPHILKWAEVLFSSPITVILGRMRTGKSALGFWFLEVAHTFRPDLDIYVIGLPQEKVSLLPPWIGIRNYLEEVPPNSMALTDEAHLFYHSRRSAQSSNIRMSQILTLAGQKNQFLIFVTQNLYQLDKAIPRIVDCLIFKEPGTIQTRFERGEISKIAKEAEEAFRKLIGNKKEYSYVFSHNADFAGLLKNPLASFWNESLSHIYANFNFNNLPQTSNLNLNKPNNSFDFLKDLESKQERKILKKRPPDIIKKIKRYLKKGYSYREIAERLNISKSLIGYYLSNYS